MVKSGLDDALLQTPGAVPRVSQYRLAAHLSSAFVIYGLMLSTGLKILWRPLPAIPSLRSFYLATHVAATVLFLTIISGAFVAGLDAGLIYNEFPRMGEGLIPSDMWALSDGSIQGQKVKPRWKNFFENPSTVQFDHRLFVSLILLFSIS